VGRERVLGKQFSGNKGFEFGEGGTGTVASKAAFPEGS
jgi:hypothetical protein